jgi:hypothetical protein
MTIFAVWVCNFILKLAKHVHAKFQLSSLYPDGLRHIFDHFWRKFQDFIGKLLSEFRKIPNLQFYVFYVCNFQLNLAKHVHAKFQLSSFYPDGLRQIFDHVWRKFLFYVFYVCNFQLNLAKHVHAKFQLSSFYLDGLRQIFDQFWRKF